MKPVPPEGRGSRLRGNDGLQGTGMAGFRRVVQRFPKAHLIRSGFGTAHPSQPKSGRLIVCELRDYHETDVISVLELIIFVISQVSIDLGRRL